MELEKFIEKLSDNFEDTEISELRTDTIFQDLDEWSSLTALGIIAMAKTEYGKAITGREIRNCTTIKDLYELIINK
ncbi:MAG: acyl carrier protein [Muribaculaceae bacterium]|nr:acyl carrier protein [Muribaculaceae bacterium]